MFIACDEFDVCIVCLQPPNSTEARQLTIEHVIPSVLGGILTCSFLCKKCNSHFGASFERAAKQDPSIRKAISQLRMSLPKLYQRIEAGQSHLVETAVGVFAGKFSEDVVTVGVQSLSDGSKLFTDELAQSQLPRMLQVDGLMQNEVAAALLKYSDAPNETWVALSRQTRIVKRAAQYKGPDYRVGDSLNPLVGLKTAYEFAALLFGSSIYTDLHTLNEVRRCLREQDTESQSFSVEHLLAEQYQSFHGIAFEGNQPHATFQIRLFGKLAYRITFYGVAFDHKPVRYTHDLVSGQETFA